MVTCSSTRTTLLVIGGYLQTNSHLILFQKKLQSLRVPFYMCPLRFPSIHKSLHQVTSCCCSMMLKKKNKNRNKTGQNNGNNTEMYHFIFVAENNYKHACQLVFSFLAFVWDRRATIVGRMERCLASSNDNPTFVSVFIKYMYLRFFPPSTPKP